MTIPRVLRLGTERLKEQKFCERPYLDALLLFSFTTQISKESLLAAGEKDLTTPQITETFLKLITRRENGESVAAIIGEKEFYGRPFQIDSSILSPRPDTEFAVETALTLIDQYSYRRVLDLCTGSGCIALTIFLEQNSKREKKAAKKFEVFASDLSLHAQRIFALNNKALAQNQVTFILSDLFKEIKETFDLIVTNPPYLTAAEYLRKKHEGWKEPRMALDGGEDGLSFYRTIIKNAPSRLSPGGSIVIEAASSQMEDLQNLLKENQFEEIKTIPDLSGELRIITGKLLLGEFLK